MASDVKELVIRFQSHVVLSLPVREPVFEQFMLVIEDESRAVAMLKALSN